MSTRLKGGATVLNVGTIDPVFCVPEGHETEQFLAHDRIHAEHARLSLCLSQGWISENG